MTTRKREVEAGPALLVRVGVFVLAAAAAIGTPADADLWGHLRFGQDILQTGSPVQIDRYSFTSDRPWINHEWLAEVAFALAYGTGGATGLIAVKLGLIAALIAIVSWHLRGIRVPASAVFWLSILTFIGTYWRTHNVRPQLFSVLLFAVLLTILLRADAGGRRGLLLLPPVMALWVNLHGGWIVGLGVLCFWMATRVVDGRRPPGERVFLATVGLAAALATLINPHGTELWRFLAETVRFERTDIVDWGSILSYPLLVGVPWTLTGVVAVLAIVRGGWPRRDHLAIVLLAAAASARVGRLDAFYTLAVVLLFAPEVARGWPLRKSGVASPRVPQTAAIVVTAVTVVAMVVPAAWVMRPYFGCVTIGGPWAPEAEAGRFIVSNQLTGRMLTWFDWGEYAIWHAGPGLQVSMDGRRETTYSEAMIQAHRHFYAADGSASSFLEALRPDYIWIAAHLPVAATLPAQGWVPIFTGPVSSMFAARDKGPFDRPMAAPGPRCFPGP